MITIDSLVASQASGKFLVTAAVKADTTVRDTVQLTVRVPGLAKFRTGDYWSLTGSTSPEGQNHPSNHWCMEKVKDSLEAAIGGVLDIFGKWNLNNSIAGSSPAWGYPSAGCSGR